MIREALSRSLDSAGDAAYQLATLSGVALVLILVAGFFFRGRKSAGMALGLGLIGAAAVLGYAAIEVVGMVLKAQG